MIKIIKESKYKKEGMSKFDVETADKMIKNFK